MSATSASTRKYQYIADRHRVSAQRNYTREWQRWNPDAQTSSRADRLDAFHAKATYYYDKRYGINVGRFSVHGSADSGLYGTGEAVTGSGTGSPDSAGGARKEDFHDKDQPNEGRHCANCTAFVPPADGQAFGTCNIVAGPVSPDGWCMAFMQKERTHDSPLLTKPVRSTS